MSDRQYRDDDPTNPAHYRHGDKERVDFEREAMPLECFVAACISHANTYRHRLGRKDAEAQELAKCHWYLQMAAHALSPRAIPDPRDVTVDPGRSKQALLLIGPAWVIHYYKHGLLS